MHKIKSKINLNLLRTASQINHTNIWKFCYFEEKDFGIQHYIVQNQDYFKVK
jgi:hypothetical protein